MNTPKKARHFQRYKNISGASKVARFELEKDAVTIVFANASVYRYTNQSADPANISKMKTLAIAGKGLSTFIDAHVKDRFVRKVR